MIGIGERKVPPVNDLVQIRIHLHGRESYGLTEERICYHKRRSSWNCKRLVGLLVKVGVSGTQVFGTRGSPDSPDCGSQGRFGLRCLQGSGRCTNKCDDLQCVGRLVARDPGVGKTFESVPRALQRKSRVLAIDLTLLPYSG